MDLMSLPAVADWIMQSLVQGYLMGMVQHLHFSGLLALRRQLILSREYIGKHASCTKPLCGDAFGGVHLQLSRLQSGTDLVPCQMAPFLRLQVWPKQVNIPFLPSEELEQWHAPLGAPFPVPALRLKTPAR